MGYYNEHAGEIAVSVSGSAETKFTSASFTAKVVTRGASGPEAKKQAEPVIEKILSAIKTHAERAAVDTTRLKTGFAVDIYSNRNTGEFSGYQATYTATFTCKNVSEATRVHDALTSIDQVQSPSPSFSVDDSVEVFTRAFADAVGKAKARFEGQCASLGLKMEEFELLSWHIQDDRRPSGKMLALSANSGDDDGIRASIEPGKALLELGVNFVYRKREHGATGVRRQG